MEVAAVVELAACGAVEAIADGGDVEDVDPGGCEVDILEVEGEAGFGGVGGVGARLQGGGDVVEDERVGVCHCSCA